VRGFGLRMAWEAAQNVPLICGFLVSASLGVEGNWLAAGATMLIGASLAAAVIWITEPLIFPGHRETGRAVAGNVVTFSILMLLGTLYLSAGWSSWVTDIAVGLVLAVALAAGQELAARERFGIVRSLALGLSCAGSLLLIRFFVDRSLLLGMVVVNIWFTVVMGLYKEVRIMTGWVPATASQAASGQERTGDAG
jgi:hypothetical protein